ncbi:MAG TPA: L,D-transpeptidase family protein [Verrucomicrobiae bacterium]|jgi:lipoprotein-anchoring transpeptidase ErfK/SrfK
MGNRVYTKFFVPRRQRQRSATIYTLAGVATVAVVSWILWHSGDSGEMKPLPSPFVRPKAAPARPSTAVPQSGAVPQPLTRPPSRASGVRPVQDIFEAQLALDRLGISAGSIDGVAGSQTRVAVEVFQREMNLAVTGQLDAPTKAALLVAEPLLTVYTITTEDIARLRPLGATWLAKSQQDRLDYETLLELVAERSHAHPNFLRRLNPGLEWTELVAGTAVKVPKVDASVTGSRAARVRIHLASRTLEAFDERGTLIAHFPCSIAQRVEKRPVGELHVAIMAPDPNYTLDPAVFTESAEARQLGRKLILPAGPNNPVGTAWIGLDRPGYGIHGTPHPEAVGRTESHGCFRLANWNAERLLKLVWVGMPVVVEP